MPHNNCSQYPKSLSSWPNHLTGAYRLYVSPIIAVLGIVGNVFVIIVFLLEHKKSRFSIYCIAISSTHIVILLVNTLMDDFMGAGLKYRNPEFYVKFDTYSVTMCQLMEFLHTLMYTASSGLLLVFSVDRIMTIFRPMKFYSIHYRRFALFTCMIVIFVSALTNLPLLISSELRIASTRKCQINDKFLMGKISIFIKVFVTFVIPTFVILFLNCVICLKLWRAKLQRAKLMAGDSQKNDIEMNRIFGHLALNSVFLFFTFPLVIAMVLRQINNCIESYKSLSKIFSSIKDISYALDFLLYVVFLTNFRWRFIKYFLAPILRGSMWNKSKLAVYVELKLMKHDSYSSKRKYSAITVGLSSSNNRGIFRAVLCKSKDRFKHMRPPLRQCVSYTITNSMSTPPVTPTRARCASVPRQQEFSTVSDF